MGTNESISLEKRGYLTLLRLNRPDHLHAFDYEMLLQLEKHLEEIAQDIRETRVVMIASSGRAFCVGADLKERRTLNEQQVRRNVRKIRDVFTAVERLPQPTIAAINGFAFGGGLELALACDFRLAVAEAQLGLTEVSLGIIPGAGGTQRLTRLIGPSKAKELILTARKISAEEAKQLGVISYVTKSVKELEDKSVSLAEEILQNAPLAVYQAKYAIDKGLGVEMQTGLDIESKAYEVIIPTKDRVEALEAFSQKRKPHFRGE